MVRVKRVYETPSASDGRRILVDRLWPRGLSKQDAAVDEWMKEIAPSTDLRRWFAHDPGRWKEFQRRYRRDLREQGDLVDALVQVGSRGVVTLLFGARDPVHNDAMVLVSVVRARIARATRGAPQRRPGDEAEVSG